MILERLLGGTAGSVFVAQHYLRLPFARQGGARDFTHLAGWTVLERLLASPSADVLVSRAGEPWSGTTPILFAEAQRLHAEGYTITVRHAERHDAGLRELAAAFQRDFQAAVNIHLYCTPAQQHGFGWHFDAEEVFILQTEGSKRYYLRKNTVQPWPLVETIPADMGYPREIMPMLECALRAGDWLYIPSGYWHMAKAPKDSVSLSVGLMAPSGIDAFDFLRRRLLGELRWRQRLPLVGAASPCSPDERLALYHARFRELAEDLARLLGDEEFARSFLASRRPRDS
jgi:50S ribosomal protein L16 3-hydroxylase